MPSKTAPEGDVRARRASPLPPEERREAIIGAILPLLLERGSSVTTRELATAAGVAEGTIFKVFDDKDDLLRSAVERALDPAQFEEAVRALDPDLALEPRLVAATELMQRRLQGIWRLLSQVDHEVHHQRHERRLPESQAMIAIFEASPGSVRLPPRDAARQLRALVLALSNEALMDEPLGAAEIVELFLHGAGARP
jgi:AcrR family transcriptional regulator